VIGYERTGINDERGGSQGYRRGARLLGEPWIKINPSSVSCRTIPLSFFCWRNPQIARAGLKYFPSPRGNYLTPAYLRPCVASARARARERFSTRWKVIESVEEEQVRRGVGSKFTLAHRESGITSARKQSAWKSRRLQFLFLEI